MYLKEKRIELVAIGVVSALAVKPRDLKELGVLHLYIDHSKGLGLKRVLGYSDSGRCQTSTRYCRPTRVLGIYNDGRKLCCKVACGDYLPQSW